MSFYKGDVAKLFCGNNTLIWQVAEVQYIDTNCDENMNITLSHGTNVRAAFVPVAWIENFNPKTEKVRFTFDTESLSEKWQAL